MAIFKRSPGAGRQKAYVTGILGCSRGTGVTHLAILLANYLAGARGRRVALLEWNESGDFERIRQFCKGTELCGVAYFKEADAKTLAQCLDGSYDEVVLDLGGDFRQGMTEFLRCDKKVLVGSLSEWQQEEFLRVLQGNLKACRKDWSVLVSFGSAESEREIRKRLSVPLERIPFWPDAYRIAGGSFLFLESLINRRGR